MSTETLPKILASTQQPGVVFGGAAGPKPLGVYHLRDMRHVPPGATEKYTLEDGSYYVPPSISAEEVRKLEEAGEPVPDAQSQLRIVEEELQVLRSGPIGNHVTNIPEHLVPDLNPIRTPEQAAETPEPTLEELGQLTFDLGLSAEAAAEVEDDQPRRIRVPFLLSIRKRIAERRIEAEEETTPEKSEAQLRKEEVARFVGMSVFQGHNYTKDKTIVGVHGVGSIQTGAESKPKTKAEFKQAAKVQDLVTKRKELVTYLSSIPNPAESPNMTPQETKHFRNMRRQRAKAQARLDKVDAKITKLFGGPTEENNPDETVIAEQREKIAALEAAEQARREKLQPAKELAITLSQPFRGTASEFARLLRAGTWRMPNAMLFSYGQVADASKRAVEEYRKGLETNEEGEEEA